MRKRIQVLLFLFTMVLCHAETWETALAGVLTTPPAEGLDGRIYCTAEDRALHCLDGISGREYWNFRPGRKLTGYTTVSPDGIIYVQTVRNDLVAVSPGGWELWRYRLPSPPVAAPAADSYGTLYILTGNSVLNIIDRMGTGQQISLSDRAYSGVYIFQNHILLTHQKGLEIYHFDGKFQRLIQGNTDKIVIRENNFSWQEPSGDWFCLNPESQEKEQTEPPVDLNKKFPKPEVLITDDLRIVSGRNDWFMEAYKEGTESYDSRFQYGCNSSRTNSERINLLDSLDDQASLSDQSFLLLDQKYFSDLLKKWESFASFHRLIEEEPLYNLKLIDLLSSNAVISPYKQKRNELDSYTKFRMYYLLAKWGDIRNRKTLIAYCYYEKDPVNLGVLMNGLARIGMDPDSASIQAVSDIVRRFRNSESLYRRALQSAYRIALYNGEKGMRYLFDLLEYLSDQTGSSETKKMIINIMQNITG